jgi:signal transduction histidine kinase
MLTLLFIGIGFIMIILLSRRFMSPITHLANTMERAGADDLDIKVAIKGDDELALLGERFNSMMERIRQANEEIRRTHEKLIQSEKLASVGVLAAGLAHEINNPLGALFNCHYLLRQEGDDPVSRARYLNFLGEGLEKIETTINKLLWMSRKSEHSPVDVNIRNTIESVVSFVEYKLKKSNIEFINEIPGNLHATIDPHDLQQLLLNLFINAIHAMGSGGVLRVSGCYKDALVQVRITDSGCGIAPENVGRIFDPFFTTKPVGEGTGLGLWLSYEITKNNNGQISVESEVGKGTAFVVTFPASASL